MSSRRGFIKKSALGISGGLLASSTLGMSASSYNRIVGANDRLGIAYMGLGRRVNSYFPGLGSEHNVRLEYLCDVKQSQITNTLNQLKGQLTYQPKQTDDIRTVLQDEKVDALFVATPDHWHALATAWALQAGKHVYVEKPCAHNPYEEEVLVALQKRHNKIVQMGNQQRSSLESIEVIHAIHEGVIGRAYKAVAFYNNSRGEVPKQVRAEPPADLNWELFQGPAPRQDYYHDIWNYNWHWYGWKWGTGETGNNATHELDIARWALQVDYPEQVNVDAKKEHFPEDGWEMYDTMYATFKFPNGKVINWDGKSRNGLNTYGSDRGTIIYGTEGSVFVDRGGYKLYDRRGKLLKESNSKANESGVALGGGGDLSTRHVVNFYQAIRGKEKPNSPISEGVISNHLTLMANIAYRIGKPFDVDPKTGKFFDREAMDFWGRQYEPNWEVKM